MDYGHVIQKCLANVHNQHGIMPTLFCKMFTFELQEKYHL